MAEFLLHNEKELVPFVFRNGFPVADKITRETFYQVLADGDAQLFKLTHKSFTETIPYGYSKTVRTILSTDLYYIQKGGKMYKVKRDAKALQAILADQTITEYIRKNNLNIASDGDLIQTINYYNRKN
ncbi:MAG TPA: hypothetical protein VEV16_06540 [Daejeonella sp.]|nr:hypothetical protein [Daejeonella sp.]